MSRDQGSRSIHFWNPVLMDGPSDALLPEVLIYEAGHGGEMQFVGVEFVVPCEQVPDAAAAPQLGQMFSASDVHDWWGLRVWTHRTNPLGAFAAWNPRVPC